MKLTKDNVKRISPKLENNAKWHQYVDWFWTKPGMKESYTALAMGFEMGSRRDD